MTAALEEGEGSASRPGHSLPLGKTRYQLYRRLGGPQSRSGRVENLVLTGIRSPDRPARIQSLYRLSYTGPLKNLDIFKLNVRLTRKKGRDSSVGIGTGYGLDGPEIEYRWGRYFPHLSRAALGLAQPPVQWVPSLSRGVKSGRSVTLTPHPF